MLGETQRLNQLNWLRGTAHPAPPANFYLSLHTADPGATGASEVGTGVGYARQIAAFIAPADEVVMVNGNDIVTSGGTSLTLKRISNSAIITFGPASGGGFGEVTHLGIWTASTGGTFVEGGDASDVLVISGNSARVPVGALKLYRG